jgi:hypothetical protein
MACETRVFAVQRIPLEKGDTVLSHRNAALTRSGIGLAISACILALMWRGASGVLEVGGADLRHVLWPSGVMLVGGWRSTVPGIMIPASSVAINCVMYAAIRASAASSRWKVMEESSLASI